MWGFRVISLTDYFFLVVQLLRKFGNGTVYDTLKMAFFKLFTEQRKSFKNGGQSSENDLQNVQFWSTSKVLSWYEKPLTH